MNRSLVKEMIKGFGIEEPTNEMVDNAMALYSKELETAKPKDYEEVKTNYEELKAQFEKVNGDYNALVENHNTLLTEKDELSKFKNETLKQNDFTKKQDAVINLLKESKASEKALKLLSKEFDYEALQFDETGKLTNATETVEKLKNDYADFFEQVEESGKPIQNGGSDDNTTTDAFTKGFLGGN